MMTKALSKWCFLVSVLVLFLPIKPYLQEKRDYNWQLGNRSVHPYTRSIEMVFSENGLIIDTFFRPVGFEYFNTSISDQNGHLILYSNGCHIRDGNHQLIPGTEHLNPGDTNIEWCQYGYPIADGGFFIPFFGDSIVMLLHQRVKVVSPPLQIINDTLFYTSLKKVKGQYVLHEKTIKIIGDSLTDGNVKGVKSSKSGAWWIIQGQKRTNRYYTILIDSAKVDTVYSQFIGDTSIDGSAGGQAVFSPDGTMYAKYAPRDDLYLFDFDRTLGTLSNFRKIHVADSGFIGGLAFSPNSRFLYVSAHVDLYQFDIWAEDIQSSKIHIGHYDGHLDPFPTTFYHMQLGPDCRIYMNSNNGNYSWHVIHQPDQKGLDCQFEQNGIHFPVSTSITIPNFPNYRLGVAAACDPGLVNAFPESNNKSENLLIYPNPTYGPLKIKLPSKLSYSNSFIEVIDMAGVIQKRIKLTNGIDIIEIGMEEFALGIYILMIKTTDKIIVSKVMKI